MQQNHTNVGQATSLFMWSEISYTGRGVWHLAVLIGKCLISDSHKPHKTLNKWLLPLLECRFSTYSTCGEIISFLSTEDFWNHGGSFLWAFGSEQIDNTLHIRWNLSITDKTKRTFSIFCWGWKRLWLNAPNPHHAHFYRTTLIISWLCRRLILRRGRT